MWSFLPLLGHVLWVFPSTAVEFIGTKLICLFYHTHIPLKKQMNKTLHFNPPPPDPNLKTLNAVFET